MDINNPTGQLQGIFQQQQSAALVHLLDRQRQQSQLSQLFFVFLFFTVLFFL